MFYEIIESMIYLTLKIAKRMSTDLTILKYINT